MLILLFFAFVSGLITILAPCIWPLLPIVLSASATGGKRKPLGITVGIVGSFTIFTLGISYLLQIFSFDPEILRYVAVIIIGVLGLTLVVPALGKVMEGWVSKLSGKFAPTSNKHGDGFLGGLLVGGSLGIVWTPCAGPILATIATLAATQAVNFEVVLVTVTYGIGVGIPLFIFAASGRSLFAKSQLLNKYTGRIQQVFGVIMILTALAIYTNYDKTLQTKLLDAIPAYQRILNNLESAEGVESQLKELKNKSRESNNEPVSESELSIPLVVNSDLKNYGQAPEFVGITNWLNTDDTPLTMEELQGKVVLIDFWTYTCINCIRTFPHVTSWYEKYKDSGFVIVGVHTPEFAFEKKTENVIEANAEYGITYPVAQDNNYRTWRAYDNHYWPAHYLVDANGVIRYVHFGEGKYDETEQAIRDLLIEAGYDPDVPATDIQDDTPTTRNTPETYLGTGRMEYFDGDERLIVDGKVIFPNHTAEISNSRFVFEGTWNLSDEYAESGEQASLTINFLSKRVFLVITSEQTDGTIEVLLDGEPIANDVAGEDVKDGNLTIDGPRLYELVDFGASQENHLLTLTFLSPGTRVFAFTFG